MKKFLLCLLIFSTFFLSACNLMQIGANDKDTYSTYKIDAKIYDNNEELLKSVSPAVVGILATTNNYQSIGSGVCVNDKGYILTNNHVIENSNSIKLYLHNGTSANANLVWRDSSQDLAVIKSSVSLPYLPMAKNNSYKAGQDVIAIGTPISLAFKHTATKGMISAVNRTIQVDNENGYSTLSNLIQHDASINPGNSGGPLIDMQGNVLGINTVKVSDAEGLGFAIPISIGNAIINKLSANGSYNTSYLGVMGFDAYMHKIGNNEKGVYVVSVDENSPAFNAGLQKGDIITKINNKEIDSVLDLRLKLLSLEKGDDIQISFTKNGFNYNKNVTLEEHPYCYKCDKLNFKDFD